ncbi:FliG C-terminal domain-containing protein [Vibrio casei]|uniref:Flagellar motor switch protein FliG n=1 Tax=Vibrio casei TaxID=673372 RepID=A0A368LK66_9VIBR|nr:FliG C-terminal domain-containing protein [Vibrio casei]RCS70743.1 flagellar motor switch protein FliG [Vibrio casei]SJN26509.1 Flagellar motor switch protein FliG [Vibrio casei]
MQNSLEHRTTKDVALLVLAMGEEVGSKVLRNFSQDQIKQISKAMSELKDIKDEHALSALVGFFNDFKSHSGILGGSREYVSNVLHKTLNGNYGKDLVAELYGDELRVYAESLAWVPAEVLVNTLKQEHVSMQALLIAHLPVDYAQIVLGEFDDESCREIILQISENQVLSGAVTQALKELVDQCKATYETGGTQSINGTKIAASLINRYSGDKTLLFNYMKDKNPQRAQELEDALFDFFIIFSQDIKTIESITSVVDVQQWALALKGLDEETKNIVIKTYASRVATELRDQMEILGSVSKSQVDEARNDILQIVRMLREDGVIELSFGSEVKLT